MDGEDLGTLEWEQAQLDDYEDKTAIMMDHPIRLGHTKPSLTAVARRMSRETAAEPSRLLRKRLNHIECTLRSINSTIESLTPGPDSDICLVRQLEEQLGHIKAQHSDLTHDILSFMIS